MKEYAHTPTTTELFNLGGIGIVDIDDAVQLRYLKGIGNSPDGTKTPDHGTLFTHSAYVLDNRTLKNGYVLPAIIFNPYTGLFEIISASSSNISQPESIPILGKSIVEKHQIITEPEMTYKDMMNTVERGMSMSMLYEDFERFAGVYKNILDYIKLDSTHIHVIRSHNNIHKLEKSIYEITILPPENFIPIFIDDTTPMLVITSRINPEKKKINVTKLEGMAYNHEVIPTTANVLSRDAYFAVLINNGPLKSLFEYVSFNGARHRVLNTSTNEDKGIATKAVKNA